MPLKLRAEVLNPAPSIHEALRVRVELENDDAQARVLPTLADPGGALLFEVLREDGTLLRRMNGLTRQLMGSRGRINPHTETATLGAHEVWRGEFDCSKLHYPLAAGRCRLQALYRHPVDEVLLRADPVAIEVRDEALAGLSVCSDNPVLGSMLLVMAGAADAAGARRIYLRQHAPERPLAAWYAGEVMRGAPGEAPFVATATALQTRSFDPAFRRWLVWREASTLRARCVFMGRPQTQQRSASLPAGFELLPQAAVTPADELLLFARGAGAALHCLRLGDGGLETLFEHLSPTTAGDALSVCVRRDTVHLVAQTAAGIAHESLSLTGRMLQERLLSRPRRRLHAVAIDGSLPRARMVIWNGPADRRLDLAWADLAGQAAGLQSLELRLPGTVDEIAFDVDATGRTHALVATRRDAVHRLYHYRGDAGPWRIAESTAPFFPAVRATGRIYLGCQRPGLGYRFLQYAARRGEPKITDYEIVV